MTDQEFEVWKNNGAGRIVVKKRGEYGVETDEMVAGGKVLHITSADRRWNQQIAASDDLDVFQNGMLSPVEIGDSAAEFAQNANLLTEDDMRSLVRSHPKTFEKRLGEITNPVVVKRLEQIAHEENATVKTVERIQARLEEVSPVNTIKVTSHAPDERQVNTLPVTTA